MGKKDNKVLVKKKVLEEALLMLEELSDICDSTTLLDSHIDRLRENKIIERTDKILEKLWKSLEKKETDALS